MFNLDLFIWYLYTVNICRFTLLRMLEDTKGVIRPRKSKKDRQHNGQEKKKGQNDKQ